MWCGERERRNVAVLCHVIVASLNYIMHVRNVSAQPLPPCHFENLVPKARSQQIVPLL
jgi:hypothetical protein